MSSINDDRPPNASDESEHEPPPGFVQHDKDRARLWIREDYQNTLLAFPLEEPARLAAHNPAPLSGRGIIGMLEVDNKGGCPERLIVRPYLRGGLIGRVFHDRYFDAKRAIKELQLYQEAHKRGIPTLEVIGAVTRSCRGLGYRHGIITRYLEEVQDLAAILVDQTDPIFRRQGMRAAGQAIRIMHDQGFNHPDLNIKNILIRFEKDEGQETAQARAWVIDFDRGHFVEGALLKKARSNNLLRLLRSFVKFEKKQPGVLHLRDPLELSLGYFGGHSQDRAEFLKEARDALKNSLRIRLTSWRSRPESP
jgi:tRNA A-37 threonylcarbamoyl transferase component Bud32